MLTVKIKLNGFVTVQAAQAHAIYQNGNQPHILLFEFSHELLIPKY
jgi:hypothetical protein